MILHYKASNRGGVQTNRTRSMERDNIAFLNEIISNANHHITHWEQRASEARVHGRRAFEVEDSHFSFSNLRFLFN